MSLKTLIPGLPEWKEGYKIVGQGDDVYKGKWLSVKQVFTNIPTLYTDEDQPYLKGWHVYRDFEIAQKRLLEDKDFPCMIIKVQCNKPCAQGIELSGIVGVFEEIKFIEEAK